MGPYDTTCGCYTRAAIVEALARRDPDLASPLGAEHVDRAWANVAHRFDEHEA
jgi:DNA-binding GntR family transcriptional regulator